MKMKKTPGILLVLSLLTLLVTGCGETQIDTLTSTSPDGDKVMTITGSQNSPLAPIMVNFSVEVKKGTSVFATELASHQLTQETCKVVWKDNRSGEVTLVMRDGEEKVLDFVATDDTVLFINRFYN